MVDHCLGQSPQPLRRAVPGPGKDLARPDEGHQTDSDLLARHPVRAKVRRVGIQEGLGLLPEGCGIFFIPAEVVGAAQGKDETEAGRFPEELDIGRLG